MNTIRTLLSAALVACAASLAAHAQSPAPAKADASASAALTRGEVRKVDRDNRKITLKHEAITTLDMPPMTMVFQVREPALLDQVRIGDTVLFAAAVDGGQLTVTRIEAAK